MHARRLLTAGIWLATTAAATAMVWAATSVVASDVTDRPPRVVAARDVVQALEEEASPGLETAVPATTPAPAPTVAPAPATTAPARLPQTTPPEPVPTPTIPPTPTSTTTTPTTVPTPPSTAAPAPDPSATFSTAGGEVTATCSGYFIRLVAATPADGYAAVVLDRGPARVHVHFEERGGDVVRVRLVCFGGRPIRVPDQDEEDATRSESP